jgi:hypothetical protein
MHEWRIKIRVWPFSGGDEKDVGPEFQTFHVPVIDDFKMACRFADAFLMGIKCNPNVWEAHIVAVEVEK